MQIEKTKKQSRSITIIKIIIYSTNLLTHINNPD